ncbi:MAG: hypothetical protein ABIN36_06195 [Ferruginibacter sp.]
MTENQDKRKYILGKLEVYLKGKGFRKRAFTFRRETDTGLLQIIELRLGPSWSFTSGDINLEFGIYSEEWHYFLNQWATASTIRTADCEMSDCYCTIVDKVSNKNWFKLIDNLEDLILDLTGIIDKSILPYFEKHRTRKDILKSYQQIGPDIGFPPRHKLSVAILTYGLGDRASGFQLIQDEYFANQTNPFYVKLYEKVKDEFQKTTKL